MAKLTNKAAINNLFIFYQPFTEGACGTWRGVLIEVFGAAYTGVVEVP
jgi:hypothetical protein